MHLSDRISYKRARAWILLKMFISFVWINITLVVLSLDDKLIHL
jgi:hypothetical protein